jgi:hypothetical protein
MFRLGFTLLLLLLLSHTGKAQQNLLPLHTYYKDKLFSPFTHGNYTGGSYLPITERVFPLHHKIADSSKQYYDLTETLFKRHLIEVKGKDFYLTVSPTIDLVKGKNFADTANESPLQNTRGIHIEGDLFSNFSFSTSIYENQARFTAYENLYYLSIGELYPNATGKGYNTQNAIIPGAARTKPFKTSGFDYTYAIGNIVYQPTKFLELSTGNNAHFIGSGYRSLLLSDNSINAPYVQSRVKLSTKLSFVYMRSKLLNLIRRPIYTTVESNYESKGYAVNYLNYSIHDKFNISLFEGSLYNKVDSITSNRVNPLFYNPIPFLSSALIRDLTQFSSVEGLNLEFILNPENRFYSQLALSNFDFDYLGFQLGYRGYNFGKLKDFMLQLEYNNVPKNLYQSKNSRLNYVQSNLPMAHTKGNGFQEFILRANYELNRAYLDIKTIYYLFEAYQSLSVFPLDMNLPAQKGNVIHQQVELGYRFNRNMNLTLFGTWMLRNIAVTNLSGPANTNCLYIGIRTGLINHYNDF